MKKIVFTMGIAIAALASCDNTPKFNVEGNIDNAKDKMLYLENVGLESVEVLDSTKLGSNGSFDFASAAPRNPEFYRLRIENKIINFTVDSTESVKVEAKWESMPTDYTINGSESNQKIKELAIKQISLEKSIANISKAKLAPGDAQDSIMRTIARYKDEVKRNFIFKEPNKSYAYFALFQTVNSYLIFDPLNDKTDIKCFAAVATSWDNLYPHSDRALNLHNIAIRGMKNVRGPQVKEIEIDPNKVNEASLINIALPDVKGNIHNLTDLKGKVVLLDFTIYQHAASAQRNMSLRELYKKFQKQGFEIYQVSLDADEHFWKTNADNLPWTCVRDANGIYSNNASIYGVTNLPAFFLIGRDNVLKLRNENIKDIESEISKLL